MRRVAASAIVDRSPERVWDLYADVSGTVEWLPFVEAILRVSGPAGPGQTYRERTRFLGLADVSDWRVIGWDRPRRQVHRSTGKLLDIELVIEIERTGEGARIRQEARLRSRMPAILGRFHEAAGGFVAELGLRQAVAAAKHRLEEAGV